MASEAAICSTLYGSDCLTVREAEVCRFRISVFGGGFICVARGCHCSSVAGGACTRLGECELSLLCCGFGSCAKAVGRCHVGSEGGERSVTNFVRLSGFSGTSHGVRHVTPLLARSVSCIRHVWGGGVVRLVVCYGRWNSIYGASRGTRAWRGGGWTGYRNVIVASVGRIR